VIRIGRVIRGNMMSRASRVGRVRETSRVSRVRKVRKVNGISRIRRVRCVTNAITTEANLRGKSGTPLCLCVYVSLYNFVLVPMFARVCVCVCVCMYSRMCCRVFLC
jgi:hypothetical protein